MSSARPERDEALELALRTDRAYTGLRGFQPDRKLFRYIPQDLARSERIVPLVLVGDTLKVASADPDPDISVVTRRFPYLTVDIVLASRAEIDAVLENLHSKGG